MKAVADTDEPAAQPGSVLPVAEARVQLSAILRQFRAAPLDCEPVLIGAHRKPEAMLVPVAQFVGAKTRPVPSVLEALRAKRDLIMRIARLDQIEAVAVFGSVARGRETETSDIDLLVDPADDATLFDLAQFEMDMEMLLNRPVDAVSRRALDPSRHAQILSELVSL